MNHVTPGTAEGLHHRIHGRGRAGPLLILVHGWCCDSGYWDAQLPALSAAHPVLVPDLAGHGASAHVATDGSMAAYGAGLADLVRDVLASGAAGLPEDSPVVLVGHSMGGPVAVEAARRLGSRVRAVIGVDTFGSVGAPPPAEAAFAGRLAPFVADFASTTRQFVSQAFFLPGADPSLRDRIAGAMASADPAVGLAALRGIAFWDGAEALASLAGLDIPVAAINAAATPTDEARLRALAPRFRLRRIEGAGHFVMIEQPLAFNELLLGELAALRGAAATQA